MPTALALAVDELLQVVDKLPDNSKSFANSLIDQFRSRGFSAKQAVWVERLIERAKAPPVVAVQVGSMQRIVEMLQAASQHLKSPAILVRAGNSDLRLSMAGKQSKAPGTVQVCSTESSYSDRTWYGRVRNDGTFEPSKRNEPATQTAIIAALTALATDPEGAAAAYGRMTGVCCFCNRKLTDDRSTEVGYGPVCARHFKLKWGK